MRSLFLVLVTIAAALALPSSAAAIGPCGLPTTKPLWVDFGTPGPINDVFRKPGLVLSASTGEFPAQLRAAGVKTVFWDMNFNRRVGTPTTPASADVITTRADALFAFASQQSACDKPRIVLNELFGAGLETPWTATNTRYRANVLAFVRRLAERGAKPYVLIPVFAYTGSPEAAAWWQEVAKHADLVPEVYFSAPSVHRQGAVAGSRRMRTAMRRALDRLTQIQIPAEKLGIVLGFQSASGAGGREGLEPAPAWFEVVKWQTLAAKQVAREYGISTIVSWGWASYRASNHDDEKIPTACVYLWTRDAALCDAPAMADFNTSREEGQLLLAAGRECSFGARSIATSELAAVHAVTGDRDIAFSTLLARVAESEQAQPIPGREVLAAERAVILLRFRGSRAAYLDALRRAGATLGLARSVLRDELRRLRLERFMRARPASPSQVSAFYLAYPDLLVRPVEVQPGPWWLSGRTRGLALAELAPGRIFTLPLDTWRSVRALDRVYRVRALDEVAPLGSVPLEEARPTIAAALWAFRRRAAFENWTIARQTSVLNRAVCRRDDLPEPSAIRLTGYLPFLSLTG
jgi:hypothetical protein